LIYEIRVAFRIYRYLFVLGLGTNLKAYLSLKHSEASHNIEKIANETSSYTYLIRVVVDSEEFRKPFSSCSNAIFLLSALIGLTISSVVIALRTSYREDTLD
jgi:hypothetical protein